MCVSKDSFIILNEVSQLEECVSKDSFIVVSEASQLEHVCSQRNRKPRDIICLVV